MKIQLLTIPECPHAADARALLQRVLISIGRTARIEEIDLSAPGVPDSLRGWVSPTILIDGVDIERGVRSEGDCCRLYRDSDGRLRGLPGESAVRIALEGASRS